MIQLPKHKRNSSIALGLRFKSDSQKPELLDNTPFDNSLPRGEYYQTNSSMKLNLNHLKLEPIHHKKLSVELDKETIEQLTSMIFRVSLTDLDLKQTERKLPNLNSDSSENESENHDDSNPNTPNRRFSKFSGRKIIDATNLGHVGFHTPVIGKKKADLYKISILSQLTRKSGDGSDSNENKPIGDSSNKDKLTTTPDLFKSPSENKIKSEKTVSRSSFKVKTLKSKEGDFDLKKLVFASNVDPILLKRHIELILRGLNYSLNLLKPPPTSYIQSKQINLREIKSEPSSYKNNM